VWTPSRKTRSRRQAAESSKITGIYDWSQPLHRLWCNTRDKSLWRVQSQCLLQCSMSEDGLAISQTLLQSLCAEGTVCLGTGCLGTGCLQQIPSKWVCTPGSPLTILRMVCQSLMHRSTLAIALWWPDAYGCAVRHMHWQGLLLLSWFHMILQVVGMTTSRCTYDCPNTLYDLFCLWLCICIQLWWHEPCSM